MKENTDLNLIKVSVIVPVYNSAKYLRRCLDSLVGQTLSEIEIVIIDDGSTDESASIIAEYQEKYPSKIIYKYKENGGQASARNIGLAICSGIYVGFLDSDDYVNFDMFEKMYSAAEEHNADYVACGFADILQKGENTKKVADYIASRPAWTPKDMFIDAYVSPFLHLYRAELIRKAKINFPEGYIYEDTAFYLNLIPYIDSIFTIEEPLAYRVKHQNSTMSTISSKRIAQIFDVLDIVLNFYKENDYFELFHDELEYFAVKLLLCSSFERICKLEKYKDKVVLTHRTLEYIKCNFPNYKKNDYFKGGLRNIYIHSFNKFLMYMYILIFSIKVRIIKDRG